jgi:hypothetical protein
MKEIIFNMSKEEFKQFLDIAKELVKINDDFKILFLEKGILIYTIMGENSGKINALKIFNFKYGEIFKELSYKTPFSITIMNGKKFCDKMNLVLNSNLETFETIITYNKDFMAYNFSTKNEELQVRCNCQSSTRIKDLDFKILEERLNSEYSDWNFMISNEQLKKVLNMSKLEKDNECVSIRVDNGDVYFHESDWDLKICSLDSNVNGNWSIKKDYVKRISNCPSQDSFNLSIFPTYIVANETKSYFLFSMDLTD